MGHRTFSLVFIWYRWWFHTKMNMAFCIWTCNGISLEINVYFCATLKWIMNSQNSDHYWTRTLFFFRLLGNLTCLRCPPGAVVTDGFVWDTDLLIWSPVWNSSSLPYSFCICWYSEHVRERWTQWCLDPVRDACWRAVPVRSALQGPFKQM